MRVAIDRIAASTANPEAGPTTAAMYKLPYDAGVTRILLDRLAWLQEKGITGKDYVSDEPPSGVTGPITTGEHA